jgi:F-type H+-transporting ATPase subunit a
MFFQQPLVPGNVHDEGVSSVSERFLTLYEHLLQYPYFRREPYVVFNKNPPIAIWGITNHLLAQVIAAVLLFLVFTRLAKQRQKQAQPKGVLQNMLEAVVFYVRDEMVYKNMGEHYGRKFLPFFLTQFFFILTLNLFGLLPNFLGPIPGLDKLHFPTTATANISVTLALALVTFLYTHISGIREQGAKHYFQSLIPPGLHPAIGAVMYPIEILGHLIKPTALTVRLFANMTGGHLALLTIYGLIYLFATYVMAISYSVFLVGIGFSVFLTFLELIVALLQAYVFTLLSIIFVGTAVHPDH